MNIEELILYKEKFKSVVYWRGQITARKNDVSTLTRYDKNGSHEVAILRAMKYLDEAKETLKEKLEGKDYDYMMLSLRKATALYNSGRKKDDLSKFRNFNPFEERSDCQNCQGCGCTTCGGSGYLYNQKYK